MYVAQSACNGLPSADDYYYYVFGNGSFDASIVDNERPRADGSEGRR